MSADTPEELLPPHQVELCAQPNLWLDQADEDSHGIAVAALRHLVDGTWYGNIDGFEDATNPLFVHLRLKDALGEPLRISWRHLPEKVRTIQVVYIGHPDHF